MLSPVKSRFHLVLSFSIYLSGVKFLFIYYFSDGVKISKWQRGEGAPQREDAQQRLRWQAHLEFTHNHTVGDLTWDKISPTLARSDRLRTLVLGGIPHSMRPQVSTANLFINSLNVLLFVFLPHHIFKAVFVLLHTIRQLIC